MKDKETRILEIEKEFQEAFGDVNFAATFWKVAKNLVELEERIEKLENEKLRLVICKLLEDL